MGHIRSVLAPNRDRAVARSSEPESLVKRVEIPNGISWPQPSIGDSDSPGDTVVGGVGVVGHDCRIDIQIWKIRLERRFFGGRHRSRHTSLLMREFSVAIPFEYR